MNCKFNIFIVMNDNDILKRQKYQKELVKSNIVHIFVLTKSAACGNNYQ